MDPDFIVSDLLSELKAENERKSKLVKDLVKVICGSVIAILALVAGFLLYLNQYDYADIDTTNATGVYTVVDSSGNVIASDLTSDEINQNKITAKDQELQTANFQLSQQAQNATLISALRPFPQPAYITCSPYTAANGFGCGCNPGCNCA